MLMNRLIVWPWAGLLLCSLGRRTDAAPASATKHRRHYCGGDLADALGVVCEGRGYNRHGTTTRYKRLPGDGWIVIGTKRSTGRPECCRRPCSYEDLETYCAPSSDGVITDEETQRRTGIVVRFGAPAELPTPLPIPQPLINVEELTVVRSEPSFYMHRKNTKDMVYVWPQNNRGYSHATVLD